jgi:hypothetical protein
VSRPSTDTIAGTLAPQLKEAGDNPPAALPRPLLALSTELDKFGTGQDKISVPAIKNVTPSSVWAESRSQIQSAITDALDNCEWEHIKSSFPIADDEDKVTALLFLSASHRRAGAWLTANPSQFYTALSDEHFIDAVRRRLCYTFQNDKTKCPLCKKKIVDRHHLHAQRCSKNHAARSTRHTRLKNVLAHLVRVYFKKFSVQNEPPMADVADPKPCNTKERRADLLVTSPDGTFVVIDTVINYPNIKHGLETGATSEASAAAKIKRYVKNYIIDEAAIIPFAVDTNGAMNVTAELWLKTMAKTQASSTGADGSTTVDWTYYGYLVRVAFEMTALAVQRGVSAVTADYRASCAAPPAAPAAALAADD